MGHIIYTEGTTGASKGVMLTHANISSSTRQLRAWFPDMKDGEESILAIFPFFHPAGWTGVQDLSILAGWTDVLVPHPDPLAVIETHTEAQARRSCPGHPRSIAASWLRGRFGS